MQDTSSVRFEIVEDLKQRLDAYLAENLEISRAQATKTIEAGLCLVNGKQVKRNYQLKAGDSIDYKAIIENNELVAEEGELDILYQDNDYIIINKPPNLTVHPAPSQEEGTLVHILLSHFPEMRLMEGLRPGIVHRIDKDTSGIIVVALHDKARRALSELFEIREVHKEYLALVYNNPPKEGLIDLPIGRHEKYKTKMAVVSENKGKHALTEYQTIYADKERNYALLAVKIHTGRTHQIRVHLTHEGYPLLGDKLYTAQINKPLPPALKASATRQMLHAWKIRFKQPLSGKEIDITCPIPKDMQNCIDSLKRKLTPAILTGSTGSGKSSALKTFETLGYSTFSADEYIQSLYAKDGSGTFLLKRLFGDEVLKPQGEINKQALFLLMQDPANKEKVEKIIHPLVYRAMLSFFDEAESRAESLAFAEIPLYFESDLFTQEKINKFKVITVYCDEDIRTQRLEARGLKPEFRTILDSWQLGIESKKAQSDFLINNSKGIDELKNLCAELIDKLI